MIDDALDLRTYVFDMLGNASMADKWPRIVTMTERRLNQVLRTTDQVTDANVVMANGQGTLPTDYLEMIRVGTAYRPYREVHSQDYDSAYDHYDYSIEGSTLSAIVDDGNLPIKYYASLPTLANDLTATNWLLTTAPDVYLFGTLAVATIGKPESVGYFENLRGSLAGLKTISNRKRFGNSNVRIEAV
ncbi:MAG: hypothetical protein AAFW66_00110 [Pseudomonadota bacterium]